MAKTYYNSQLTGDQIENVLEAIHSLMTSSNSGKVIGIDDDGNLVAVSIDEETET